MTDNTTVSNNALSSNADIPVKTTFDGTSHIQHTIPDQESTVLYAKIAAASSGANEIVAAVATKKIKVLRYSFSSSGTVNAKWQSAATDLSGLYYEVSNTGISEPYCPIGIVQTNVGEALNLNLSGNVAVGGSLTYILV